MKTLAVFPSKFEAAPLFSKLGAKANLGARADLPPNFRAFVAGIGCAASARRLEAEVGNFAPDLLILVGYCGACNPALENGDFIFEPCGDPRIDAFAEQTLGCRRAKIASVDFTADSSEKQKLFADGFDAVEMEKKHFKPIAELCGAKFLHVRCVSDSKKSALPAALLDSTMDRRTGAVNPAKMFSPLAILRRPKVALELAKFIAEILPVQKRYASLHLFQNPEDTFAYENENFL